MSAFGFMLAGFFVGLGIEGGLSKLAKSLTACADQYRDRTDFMRRQSARPSSTGGTET